MELEILFSRGSDEIFLAAETRMQAAAAKEVARHEAVWTFRFIFLSDTKGKYFFFYLVSCFLYGVSLSWIDLNIQIFLTG